MAIVQSLWVTINLYKKCFPLITWHKKHSSKQVGSMIYTPEKYLFAAATFKAFVRRFFSDRVKKFVVYFGLHEPSLHS